MADITFFALLEDEFIMEKKPRFLYNPRWQRNALIVLCSVLAVILIALAAGTIYIHSMLNRLNRLDPSDHVTLSPSQAENLVQSDPDLETIDPSTEETLPELHDDMIDLTGVGHNRHGSHVINILLVGQDRRPGEGRQRSDSMILLTLNKSQKTLTLTSFMRDQYVDIPGYLPNKLNAAYAFGGFPLLNKTLERNFGVYVDGNVEVDFDAFTEVIDLLGGVEITLTQAEADYLMTDLFGHTNIKPGKQTLSGAVALSYSRIRQIDSDYRRAERQRTVLISLLEKYRQQSVSEMLSILNEVLPMVTTDMSNGEILSLAGEILPMLSGIQVNNLRIPVDGSFEQGNVLVRDGLKNWFQYHIDFKMNYQRLQMLYEK